jgi:hypothetical protein
MMLLVLALVCAALAQPFPDALDDARLHVEQTAALDAAMQHLMGADVVNTMECTAALVDPDDADADDGLAACVEVLDVDSSDTRAVVDALRRAHPGPMAKRPDVYWLDRLTAIHAPEPPPEPSHDSAAGSVPEDDLGMVKW